MKKNVFIATITIAIEASCQSDAADSIHGIMSDQDVVDWQYSSDRSLILAGEYDLSGLAEGEIFRIANKNNHPVS